MWDLGLRPMAWMLAFLLGLVGWWLVMRLLFKAYYRSRLEYYKQIKDDRGKQEDRS